MRTIPRGVDPALFDPDGLGGDRIMRLARQWRLPDGMSVVMLPGRLTGWKGHAVLIAALAKLQRPDVVCVFVGSEGRRVRYSLDLLAQARALGVGDRVRLVGECDDMPAALMLADVVVHASTKPEAFGRVVIEAQAMRRLVVASDLGGPVETVGAGSHGLASAAGRCRRAGLRAGPCAGAAVGRACGDRRAGACGGGRALHDAGDAGRDAGRLRRIAGVTPPATARRILVIKLGALGDFVLAFAAFAAIRAQHPAASITLLTTEPFVALGERSPWFNAVSVDARPGWWNPPGVLRLARQLRGFDFVYDLQTSDRSSRYHLLAGRPSWSGIAPGSSHRHANPARNTMHTVERQRDQLAMAGVTCFPPPDLAWLTADAMTASLPERFALLVPGAAPHRPAKRWPAAQFGALGRLLAERGLAPVVVGTRTEAPLAAVIRAACPQALDLTGQTGLAELAAIAARAAVAVGNDTGPMHLAAAVGCRCVVLFSGASDPALTAPRGDVTVLRERRLADLPLARVAAALA